jgi:hypothetical protein
MVRNTRSRYFQWGVKQGCGYQSPTYLDQPARVTCLGKISKNKRCVLFQGVEVAGTADGTAHLDILKEAVFFDTDNEVFEALEKCCEWLIRRVISAITHFS